jgi:hypothetical protein
MTERLTHVNRDSSRQIENQSRGSETMNTAGLAQAAEPSLAKGAAPTQVEVWKDPSCGCCKDWIAHMEANGFKVFVNFGASAARARLGIPQNMASCHTALVGGYAIEGHVPAREIRRLLREKPVAIGLAAPGMPIGAPGMDTPAYAGKKNPYNVMLVARNGSATVYQKYEGNNL